MYVFHKESRLPYSEPTKDGMKIKTILAIMAIMIFLASCARSITPYEAANGKARCGRTIR